MYPRCFCRLPPPTRCGRKKRQDAAILTVRRGGDVRGSVGCAGGGVREGNLPVFLSRAPLPSPPPPPLPSPPAPYRRLCAPLLFENCILSVSHGRSEHLLRLASVDAARGLGLILTLPSPFCGAGGSHEISSKLRNRVAKGEKPLHRRSAVICVHTGVCACEWLREKEAMDSRNVPTSPRECANERFLVKVGS